MALCSCYHFIQESPSLLNYFFPLGLFSLGTSPPSFWRLLGLPFRNTLLAVIHLLRFIPSSQNIELYQDETVCTQIAFCRFKKKVSINQSKNQANHGHFYRFQALGQRELCPKQSKGSLCCLSCAIFLFLRISERGNVPRKQQTDAWFSQL